MGLATVILDSDGDLGQLIPLWLEGGVTGILPFEVRAGMDVVSLGQALPRPQIRGGIDKHQIAKGGGATLDHWVPPTISLEGYRNSVERVRGA